jgi:putative holliday junction resolvase
LNLLNLEPPSRSRILALDVGDRRIGLACSDPSGFLASPVGVYRRTHPDVDLDYIERLADENEAAVIVVGLPINMNGSEGPQAEKTRNFAAALAARGLTVELWDERLTTVEATRMLQEQGMKRQRIDRHVDELAATLILEGYLLSRSGNRGAGSER